MCLFFSLHTLIEGTVSRAVDLKMNTLLSVIPESYAELSHVIHGWVTGKLSQRSPALGAAKASSSTYTTCGAHIWISMCALWKILEFTRLEDKLDT